MRLDLKSKGAIIGIMKVSLLPTPSEIHAAYQQGEVAVRVLFEAQAKLIRNLEATVQALEDQIAKNSQNSSKPPSSDGLNKPSPRSLRQSSGKPNGGQKGHVGHRLEPVDKPQHIEIHAVAHCCYCQAELAGVEASRVEKRQVFDLPEVTLEVTEHQAEVKTCPVCGYRNHAEFPVDVTQATQYGPRARAQMVYFNVYHFIPLERTSEILSELYQQPVSEGTIVAAAVKLAEQVGPINEQIKVHLVETGKPVHFDETGARVEGKLAWLHSASTEQATYYAIHPKRGSKAMDEIGILPYRTGWSIHDAWQPYLKYLAAKHGLCNAHLVRQLVFLIERYSQAWATDLLDLLLNMKQAVDTAKSQGQPALSRLQIADFEPCYDRVIERGVRANPLPVRQPNQRGRLKQSPARNLLDRLISHRDKVLAFIYDFDVPFENNLVQQGIKDPSVKRQAPCPDKSNEKAVPSFG